MWQLEVMSPHFTDVNRNKPRDIKWPDQITKPVSKRQWFFKSLIGGHISGETV